MFGITPDFQLENDVNLDDVIYVGQTSEAQDIPAAVLTVTNPANSATEPTPSPATRSLRKSSASPVMTSHLTDDPSGQKNCYQEVTTQVLGNPIIKIPADSKSTWPKTCCKTAVM